MRTGFKIFLALSVLLPTFSAYAQESEEPTLVDVKGRRAFNISLPGDAGGYAIVGNVIAYHNGAVMLCDSAVRYSDNRLQCFGNVLINKDSTYIYGDRADYNGDTNTAQVFSPLIKMIDGDAVLYTYNFLFNTLDNIGEYYGGGTMMQNGTLLESDRGYYFADTKDVIGAGKAELRDSTYQIKSDSIGYNMDTEIATFLTKTYIWNEKEEILSANQGYYYTKDERYHFTSDAYILTETREIWADDIDYLATLEDIVMRRNIQIRDEEEKILAFGDYGQYWGDPGNAMMTENPSLVSFYEQPDTVYMRSDSMFMYVVDSTSIYNSKYKEQIKDTASDDDEEELLANSAAANMPVSMASSPETGLPVVTEDTVGEINAEDVVTVPEESEEGMDSDGDSPPQMPEDNVHALSDESQHPPETEGADDGVLTEDEIAPADVTQVAEPPGEPLSKKEQRRIEKQERRNKREAENSREQGGQVMEGISNAADGDMMTTDGQPEFSEDGADVFGDEDIEEEVFEDGEISGADTEGQPDETVDDEEADAAVQEEEQEERVFIGYRNVKIFRSDAQAVCDSLIGFSIDSTAHMYINPVLWSGENQIKSDVVDIYTRNEKIDKAVFTGGNPIMISELDHRHYNQVTGKVMEAFFEDNELYRLDANANALTYYYLQDEKTDEIQSFLVVESSDASFYIVDQTLEKVRYRGTPVFKAYPMDMIPSSQDQRMSNFAWEIDRKPTKEEVFSRTIKPSQRDEYTALETPVFPLTDKINLSKQALLEEGLWRDRTDPVSDEALEYISILESS